MACDNYYEAIRPLSVQMFFAVVTNQMEERVLKPEQTWLHRARGEEANEKISFRNETSKN